MNFFGMRLDGLAATALATITIAVPITGIPGIHSLGYQVGQQRLPLGLASLFNTSKYQV